MSTATKSADVEFRATEDDAWYGVRLLLEKETLRVKYCDFPSDFFDERFRSSDFKDSKSLEDFTERFRPVSIQLQDHDCRKVIEGKTVCVSVSCGDNELKFYDAVIETVFSANHALENGEEVCACIFVVLWQHGPNAGMKHSIGIANICLIQYGSAQVDPALNSFLELSRKKLDKDGSLSSAPKDSTCCIETHGSFLKYESNRPFKSPECYSKASVHFSMNSSAKQKINLLVLANLMLTFCSKQEVKSHKQPDKMMQKLKGNGSNGPTNMGQDTDLGGDSFRTKHLEATSVYHFLLIDHLEKDISPSAIVDFIYQQTSVLCQAFVSPSLLSEAYTRGAIFVENQEKVERLSRFLYNPAHIIMSARGRPWVITEMKWRLETFGAMALKYEKKPQNKNELADKIKVVQKGTKEYENGNQLRDLFLEFCEHQERLHKRLALEGRKLMQ